jgi:hypothetical protein
MPFPYAVGQSALVHLGLDLVRDQFLVDEPPSAVLDLVLLVGQRIRTHGESISRVLNGDSARNATR